MIDALFVMEQHIGHYAFYQNLRFFVDPSTQIRPVWVPVTYEPPPGLRMRLPGALERLRGALIGCVQVRTGLRKYPHQVAFFNTQAPAALAGARIYRRPYVVSTDVTPIQYDAMGAQYGHTPDRDGPIGRYKRRVNLRLMRGAARVVAWSRWAAESVRTDYGVAPERIEVVPPGVDCAQWQPRPRPEGGPLRILFVGGDLARKGGDDLLQAFSALPPGLAELTLVTRSAIAPLPGVKVLHNLTPNSPELRAVYQSSDLFALPSLGETFGIAAVEAAAVGLPVIVTAVGGLQDIVVDGETGFVIPPGDPGALAQRIELLAANPLLRRTMGAAGRTRVETVFNAQTNSQRIVEILVEAAALSPAGRARRGSSGGIQPQGVNCP